MIKNIVFVCLCMISFGACQNDSEERKVQEIKGKAALTSNADIIRNPVSANEPTDTVNVAKFEFEQIEYDFGTVLEGQQVKHDFKFKNVGKVPLIITDARSTCGCTVPSYPEAPIAPGESGVISVNFNTVRKLKDQVKPVTITANTYPAKTVLRLRGYVHPQKKNPLLKDDQNTNSGK